MQQKVSHKALENRNARLRQHIPLKNEYILHERLNIYCICLRIYTAKAVEYILHLPADIYFPSKVNNTVLQRKRIKVIHSSKISSKKKRDKEYIIKILLVCFQKNIVSLQRFSTLCYKYHSKDVSITNH